MPKLSPEKKKEIISCPWETKSDSFYFVNDALIMHQKAEYNYAPEWINQFILISLKYIHSVSQTLISLIFSKKA